MGNAVALADAAAYLRCPVCRDAIALVDGALRCGRGHSFDVARQGYVNLLAGDARPGTGDSAAMVAARDAFLSAGHYEAIATAVAEVSAAVVRRQSAGGVAPCVVDLGAGTGYYLARSLQRSPGSIGLALDLSKHAVRRAARAHPRVAAVVCDAWQSLPVRTAHASAVLSVFAPRNGEEIARMLRPDGSLVVVTPTARHLRELVEPLKLLGVEPRKEERLAQQLAPELALHGASHHEWTLQLDHGDVETVVGMGPSAWHTDGAASRAVIARMLEPVAVTASVRVSVFGHAGSHPAGLVG